MFVSRFHVLGLALFTLSWLSYDHYKPWVNFHAEALAIAGLFVLVLSQLLRTKGRLNAPKVSAWIGLLAFWPWVQYLTGISLFAGDALISSLYLCVLAGAVWVGFRIAQPIESGGANGLAAFVQSLWIAAMVSAAIGIAQWFYVQEPIGMYVVQGNIGDRAMGNLGQANQLATLLLIGMVAYSWAFDCKVIGRLSFAVGIAFMTLALVMTNSRAGLLSVFLISGFLIWKMRTLNIRLKTPAILLWVALVTIGFSVLPAISEILMLSEAKDFSRSEAISQRLTMWKQIGSAVWQSPWFGYGWNQTPTAHAVGAVAFPSSITFTNAHSFVADILAWNGIPLGLAFTAVVGWWFLTRLWTSANRDGAYAMAALLPFAMHSMVEYPFAYSYFLVAAGVLVGVAEARRVQAETVRLNTRWFGSVLLLWAGVCSYLVYEYLLIEEDFRIVRFENLNLGRTPSDYVVPDIWMASHMATMLKASRLRAHTDMRAEEIETLRTASSRFAYGPLRSRYAQALALNGRPQEAGRQMAIVRAMYGDVYYGERRDELRKLMVEKYPHLDPVLMP